MKYFLITCPRGHIGTGRTTEITFAMMAENLLEAIDKARKMPSVKHSRMVLNGREVSKEKYDDFRKISAYERYSLNYNKAR